MNRPLHPDEEYLGTVIIQLLAVAADRWATGRIRDAQRLTEAAWRLTGNDTFIDDEPTNPKGTKP